MTPPLPPLRVDIRFTASRAHRMLPVTLMAIMRWMRSTDISSTRTALADDAAIVDQRAERPELVGGLEQRQDIAFLGDIAFHRDRLAVAGADLRDDLVGRGLVAGIADDDPKAARRRRDGGGAADAAATAGNNDYFVGQIRPQYLNRILQPRHIRSRLRRLRNCPTGRQIGIFDRLAG